MFLDILNFSPTYHDSSCLFWVNLISIHTSFFCFYKPFLDPNSPLASLERKKEKKFWKSGWHSLTLVEPVKVVLPIYSSRLSFLVSANQHAMDGPLVKVCRMPNLVGMMVLCLSLPWQSLQHSAGLTVSVMVVHVWLEATAWTESSAAACSDIVFRLP